MPVSTASLDTSPDRLCLRTATSHPYTRTGPSRDPCTATATRGTCTGARQVGVVSWRASWRRCPQPGLLVLRCCVKMSLNAEQINLRMIDRVVRKSTFGGFLHFRSSFYATSLVESPRSPLAFPPLPFLIIPI